MIRRRRPDDPFPLSHAQYRLWFLDQLTPGSAAYNVTDAVRVHGRVDAAVLRAALDAVVERHEVLRTTFVAEEGVPAPVVAERQAASFREVDLSAAPAEGRERILDRLLKHEAARPFDLSRDVMLRGVLFRLEDGEYAFFHNSHHIAWDLRSKFVFYRELSEFYRAFSTGTKARLPELPLQYSDYALWERQRLRGEFFEGLVSYWRERLTGAALRLELPADFPRPSILTYRGGPRVPFVLERRLLAAMEGLAPAGRLPISKALLWTGIAPFPPLLAAFNVLLFAYSGQQDILVSSPYNNREDPLADLIGFFPNTMILRAEVSPELTFRQLAVRVLDTVQEAVRHAALPFDKIVETLRPVRRPGRLPLVQVNFRIQRTPLPVLELHRLLSDTPYWVDSGASKFDLALEVVTTPELPGYFEYSADLFKQETVAGLAADLALLVGELACKPDVRIAELETVRAIRGRFATGEAEGEG